YQELEEQLKAHLGNRFGRTGKLPPISEETLQDTYHALLAVLDEKNDESVDTLIATLGEYELKSEDAVRLERIKIARRKSDWSTLKRILEEVK
ncbi:MAG: hypothetical protein IJ679_02215, partial [Lachnospiraceae bacterium]|nr:hypothetical protein [Lachnospiraceae bacterium]